MMSVLVGFIIAVIYRTDVYEHLQLWSLLFDELQKSQIGEISAFLGLKKKV